MDAKEERDTAYVDIPGACVQIDVSDGTIIKLQEVTVDALLQINPTWKKYVVYIGNKQVPTIYSEAIKALYGSADASKLFLKPC